MMMTCNTETAPCYEAHMTAQFTAMQIIGALVLWLRQATAVHLQRRALGRMTAQQRQDIGISAQDAHREVSRPFWSFSPQKPR